MRKEACFQMTVLRKTPFNPQQTKIREFLLILLNPLSYRYVDE